MIYENGYEYVGDWKNDLKNGYGIIKMNIGKYEGEWKNNLKNGRGIMIIYDMNLMDFG